MSEQHQADKEKFTTAIDPAVQAQVDTALEGVNLDNLYGFDQARPRRADQPR